jgi:hypothetical protein
MTSTLPESFSDATKRVRRYFKAKLLGIKEQLAHRAAPVIAKIMPWHQDATTEPDVRKSKGAFWEGNPGHGFGARAGSRGGHSSGPGEDFVTVSTVEFGALTNATYADPVDIAARGMCHAYEDKIEKTATTRKPFPLPFKHLNYMPSRDIGPITEDAVVLKHMKDNSRRRVIYGSDTVIARLMTSPLAVNSFDLQVETNGIHIVISESAAGGRTPLDNCMDYEWVNETATCNVPSEEVSSGSAHINSSVPLARENARATRLFQGQAKQRAVIGWPGAEKSQYDTNTILRYRKWTLNPGTDDEIDVVVRCQIDAATKPSSVNGSQYMRLFSLLEGPPHRAVIPWKNLVVPAGTLLAKAASDNSCKAANWAALALLAGVAVMKIALVTREHPTSKDDHEVIAVETRGTHNFASQLNLTQDRLFAFLNDIAKGILQAHRQANRAVATFLIKKEQKKNGKLLIMQPVSGSLKSIEPNYSNVDDANSRDETLVAVAATTTSIAGTSDTAAAAEERPAPRDLNGDRSPVGIDATLKSPDFSATKGLAMQSKSVAGTANVIAPEVVNAVDLASHSVTRITPPDSSSMGFDTFVCFSPKECRREDDAIAVHADGTISLAICIPPATPKIIEYARDGHIDHMYWGISEAKCYGDPNCTKSMCTFRHTKGVNKEMKLLKKIMDLKPSERAGFQEGESSEAVVFTFDPTSLDAAPIRTSVRQVQVRYWHAETLPPLHAEAAHRMNHSLSGPYTGDVMRFDEYIMDERGNRVRKDRCYTFLRFYVETCMDRFNDYAQDVCFAAGVPVTLMGQRYPYPPARRVIKNEKAGDKVTAVIVTNKDPNTVCCFTHPLRDYECMYNIHTLHMVLTKRTTHPHPAPTQAYLDERNEVLKYVKRMCYANF